MFDFICPPPLKVTRRKSINSKSHFPPTPLVLLRHDASCPSPSPLQRVFRPSCTGRCTLTRETRPTLCTSSDATRRDRPQLVSVPSLAHTTTTRGLLPLAEHVRPRQYRLQPTTGPKTSAGSHLAATNPTRQGAGADTPDSQMLCSPGWRPEK
jgi:hypothetical protein